MFDAGVEPFKSLAYRRGQLRRWGSQAIVTASPKSVESQIIWQFAVKQGFCVVGCACAWLCVAIGVLARHHAPGQCTRELLVAAWDACVVGQAVCR